MPRSMLSVMVVGALTLGVGAGCAHSRGSQSDTAIHEARGTQQLSSPHDAHREAAPSMRPTRVYGGDELSSAGTSDLGEAMRRLGHR